MSVGQYLYIFVSTYISICSYVSYERTYARPSVHPYVCIFVRSCICMYLCLYMMSVCMHERTNARTPESHSLPVTTTIVRIVVRTVYLVQKYIQTGVHVCTSMRLSVCMYRYVSAHLFHLSANVYVFF